MSSFYELSYNELKDIITANGLAARGANVLYNWHYKKKNFEPCVEDLSKGTKELVYGAMSFGLPKISHIQKATDLTVKFLFELEDGSKVETVLIPFNRKYSVCLSTQVGCAMKCSFCFTGMQGLKRNLKVHEIIGQLMMVHKWLGENRPGPDARILNVVFMGQGEPLHNFDAVKKACDILIAQEGASMAAQRITVSTSGYLPGLMRWKDEMPGVNLALSLHSPFDEIRNELIPINQRYPLKEVLKFIDDIPLHRKQFITYEYLLIKNLNDSEEDAKALAELLKDKRAIINLIPFNPVPGSHYQRPELSTVRAFEEVLVSFKIPTMVRVTKGDDILAACGQLNTNS